jgi:cellulose synthase/poly-beta-1,6-N-acetylglucosamine synthase-like glycosyltransferase
MDLTYLNYAITAFFTLYSAYYIVLFSASVRRKRFSRSCLPHDYRTKFLVIVPAHNEEKVIRGICSDLVSQTYDQDRLRSLIVADNSTDCTEALVREYEKANCNKNLKVVARRSETKGKGAALDYAIEHLGEFYNGFVPDYVVIFDADNRIPGDFIASLAEYAKEGYPAIQCNVKTKNPDTSLIARSSYYEGLTLQRLWQEGKDKLGLCNALAGTGEAIRYDLISAMKFGNSLTDDLDLTIRLAVKGMKVKYAHYPMTFDEKPNKIGIEFRRRVRWATGHFQTFFKYGVMLLRRPSRITIDAFFYLTNIASPLIIWSSAAISILYTLNLITFTPIPQWYSLGLSLTFLPLLFGAAALEGDRAFVKNVVPFYLLMALWLIVAPFGLVKAIRGNAEWVRTPHSEVDVRPCNSNRGIFAAPLAVAAKR